MSDYRASGFSKFLSRDDFVIRPRAGWERTLLRLLARQLEKFPRYRGKFMAIESGEPRRILVSLTTTSSLLVYFVYQGRDG